MTVSINSVLSKGLDKLGDAAQRVFSGDPGGSVPDGIAAAFGGGAIAQPGGVGSVIKKGLIGAAIGAAGGAGVGLLSGVIPFLPTITVPMGAIVGGIGGAVLGIAKGLLDNRRATLAMKSEQQAMAQLQAAQVARPPSHGAKPKGPVYKPGQAGAEVRQTQHRLKKLGLYRGKLSGRMNAATVAAIKRYELMKGAAPTGISTPELRQALNQDGSLVQKFA